MESIEINNLVILYSLQLQKNLLLPSESLEVTLKPWLVDKNWQPSGNYYIEISIVNRAYEEVKYCSAFKLEKIHTHHFTVSTNEFGNHANYFLLYILKNEFNEVLVSISKEFIISTEIKSELTVFEKSYQRLRNTNNSNKPAVPLAIETVDFIADMYLPALAKSFKETEITGPKVPLALQATKYASCAQIPSIDEIEERLSFAKQLISEIVDEEVKSIFKSEVQIAIHSTNGEFLQCLLYLPKRFHHLGNYGLLVGLHGAGMDGKSFMNAFENDGKNQLKEFAEKHQYIIVLPFTNEPLSIYNEQECDNIMNIVERLIAAYTSIDKEKVMILGHSMGCLGAWKLGNQHVNKFEKVILISGLVDTSIAKSENISLIYAFGEKDEVVSVPLLREQNDFFIKKFSRIQSCIYPEENHVSVLKKLNDCFKKEKLLQ
ncbi:alpha/beta hydrolase-fold protein [Chondrinema litorale]|uniref:alpha/beta hydrolase-fold protein n=1 Tax=Chondrinema litorale TaxID=2994555 RepID=UPI0025432B4D|nr:alpha/beta hydrolase-fold protein [Chondrinema litorale]UZR99056.1 alpha/beta hydrolase-fold protein [Chondrinema litorale]